MVGWNHRLSEHEFEQALGVGDGQGSLACCSPRGRKESDTRQLNRTELNFLRCTPPVIKSKGSSSLSTSEYHTFWASKL